MLVTVSFFAKLVAGNFGRPVGLFLLALLQAAGFAACMSPTPEKLAALDRYVAARFNVPSAERGSAAQANDKCFWKVDYTLLPSKRPITLYLSPDGGYAAPALFDLSVDPAKERAAKQEAARKLLAGTAAPDPKTGVVPTTMVIFSDYECPFCQRLAAMMNDPAVAERLKTVDVEFRNYPLSMHPWAKAAALAGACVRRQGSTLLPSYESVVFAAQRTIRPETADAQLLQIANDVPNIARDKLSRCLADHESAADVEADLKLGSLVGVEGTPTVFINGVKQPPFRTPEQLAQAVTDAAKAVASR